METKSKAETFLGFAIKARKVKMGLNAIATLKKAELIITCKSISDNSFKEALKLKNKFHCPILKTLDKELSELVFKDNVKIIAITDIALSKAIKENLGQTFIGID